MGIRGIFSKLFSGIFGVILTIGLMWGEVGGIYHAFKHHSVADGFIAVFVPPISWYRSVEFFYCKNRGAFLNLAKKSENKSQVAWPEPTEEEFENVNRVLKKMVAEPITENDLKQVRWALEKYHTRIGRPMTHFQIEMYFQPFQTLCLYEEEMNNCLLLTIDTNKPVITDKLLELSSDMEIYGLAEKRELEEDLHRLKSVATGDSWKDKYGRKHFPLTREEIYAQIKFADMHKKNLDKITKVFEEFTERD